MVNALTIAVAREFLTGRTATGGPRRVWNCDIACPGLALSGSALHSACGAVGCIVNEMALACLALVCLTGNRTSFRFAGRSIVRCAAKFALPTAITCVVGARRRIAGTRDICGKIHWPLATDGRIAFHRGARIACVSTVDIRAKLACAAAAVVILVAGFPGIAG